MEEQPAQLSDPRDWNVRSWRTRPANQQPHYADAAQLEACLDILRRKPPLVSYGEIERLRIELAEAVEGKRFVLHGGDCAERFIDCTAQSITAKLQVLLQMSLVLTFATRKPVIRIGRLAGQYAKPRSNDFEVIDGQSLPVYRGDSINDLEPDRAAREPDPRRMIDGYHHAAAGLNFIRALIEGGFADLHHPEQWDLSFIESSPHGPAYRQMVDAILDAITFMETVGIANGGDTLRRIELYTSHEALLLPYEEAMTYCYERRGAYNQSAHFLWLGYRTSEPDGAHVEYLRGLRNPIGIKIGPSLVVEKLLELIRILDPYREPGRIKIITRFGEDKIDGVLPSAIEAVAGNGHPVLWSCDPMHGNTVQTRTGQKTRRLEAVFSELEKAFAIHARKGTVLGGVHFELTGDPVTECIGGSSGVTEEDLSKCYETACDPRLNGAQALELAFLIAQLLR